MEVESSAAHKSAQRTLFDGNNISSSAQQPAPPSHLILTKAVEFNAAVIGGCLLSINAGCINGITILETGFAVSHVTGATTNAAISIMDNDSNETIFKFLGVIFFFTCGGTITGLLGGHHDDFKLGHQYGRILLTCFVLLVLAQVAEALLPNSYSFLFLCATTCGVQNGLTTKFSGNMIRTTHMTGAFTDIGITIGRIIRGRHELRWKLWLLCPMAASFFTGGLIASAVHPVLGKKSLIINILLFGITSATYIFYFARIFNTSYYNSILGDSEFSVMQEDAAARVEDTFDFEGVESYSRVSMSALRFRGTTTTPAIV